ncbi:MAG TPA: ferritin-like domain-containing protein [Polyangiaceae bacterium]
MLAFERLARELAHHGAPERLLRALHRAARDEERHADSMGALARKAGASTQRPRLRRTRPRSLEAIALENAVEGCVRETFGAAIVLAQAFTAADPDVRSAMRKIAPDELRHAELARRVARWIEPRLQPAARERVARARARATRDLVDAVAVPVATGLSLRFGNAGSEVATGIARRLGPLLRA